MIRSFSNNQDLQPQFLDLAYPWRFLFWIIKVNEVDFELFVSHCFGEVIFSVQKGSVAYLEFSVRVVRYWSRLFVELLSVHICSAWLDSLLVSLL